MFSSLIESVVLVWWSFSPSLFCSYTGFPGLFLILVYNLIFEINNLLLSSLASDYLIVYSINLFWFQPLGEWWGNIVQYLFPQFLPIIKRQDMDLSNFKNSIFIWFTWWDWFCTHFWSWKSNCNEVFIPGVQKLVALLLISFYV